MYQRANIDTRKDITTITKSIIKLNKSKTISQVKKKSKIFNKSKNLTKVKLSDLKVTQVITGVKVNTKCEICNKITNRLSMVNEMTLCVDNCINPIITGKNIIISIILFANTMYKLLDNKLFSAIFKYFFYYVEYFFKQIYNNVS